ncbi:hypothetical protein [Sedimenticola hydrogenitrophicus]|uniref:hypothetical protein n=1 Tax=Sedimenticola hydrogenitrophicus TaxID=2967975 RepID=UPI0021A84B22|nr:hypothetical protein [Sedimenticola hydrogenitrophicus]
MRSKQQINLYQPIFRKQPVAFSFNMLLILVMVSILAMASLQGLGEWQSAQLADRLRSTQAQHDALEASLARMAERLPRPTVNKMLESELQQLIEKRKSGFALLNTLKSRIAANRDGFSGIFEGLARQSFPELWFSHIAITEAGNFLSLKGQVMQPEWLPLLLKNLDQEPAFTGKHFQIVELARQDGPVPVLNFRLLTDGRGEEP